MVEVMMATTVLGVGFVGVIDGVTVGSEVLDTSRMPGQRDSVLNWPYVEGLRLDEAMHPLTLLASGIYGNALPPQDGAQIPSGNAVDSLITVTATDEFTDRTQGMRDR